MICPSCNQETEEGKFCTKCGSPLRQQDEPTNTSKENTSETHNEAFQQEGASTAEKNSESSQAFNATLEKVKTGSNQYWNYFLTRIKNPNAAFKDNEQHLTNAIVTAIILALAATLFFYGLLNTLFNDAAGIFGGDESLSDYVPFFSTILKGTLIFIILFFAGLIANFITFKLVKHPISFTQQFTRYTGTLVPFAGLFIALALLAFLGIVKINIASMGAWIMQMESGGVGDFPWGLSFVTLLFIIVMYVNPVIHMLYTLIQEKTKQSFYFTIISLVITFAVIAIVNNLFIMDILMSILESIG
ncbi:zinc ribbon domain-containing protein [Oceanobacillus sp. CFH 90083]|uniref:zinc ribbon domain-containing protein n=1 Tax=Oceanobacillus sp. CFH 90083 TaxID=2592336 RepID=UPI00128D24E8|nr:zinc ribbon domain-containing protein [Oceanobacillus sp. CFH 90083]